VTRHRPASDHGTNLAYSLIPGGLPRIAAVFCLQNSPGSSFTQAAPGCCVLSRQLAISTTPAIGMLAIVLDRLPPILRRAGFWIAVFAIIVVAFGASRVGTDKNPTTTEAILFSVINVTLSIWSGVSLGKAGTISREHARSMGRQTISTTQAVRESRTILSDVTLPENTHASVHVAIAQAEGALAVAESSLINTLEDLRDIQPDTPYHR